MVQTRADVDPTTAAGEASCAASTWRSARRRKIRAAVLVTACVLAVEFAFLTWLYHFDDGAQERSQATARASVALAGWHPGEDPAPVVQELEALADSGVADADQLRTLTSRWTESGSASDTEALTRATEAAGRAAAAELRSADRKVSLILVVVPAPRLVGLVRLVPAPGSAPP